MKLMDLLDISDEFERVLRLAKIIGFGVNAYAQECEIDPNMIPSVMVYLVEKLEELKDMVNTVIEEERVKKALPKHD